MSARSSAARASAGLSCVPSRTSRSGRQPRLVFGPRSSPPSLGQPDRARPHHRRAQYSYAKATRYDDRVVQLGPLSDLVVGRDPLITSLFDAHGPNTWLRQFARFHRPVQVLASMRQTLNELDAHRDEPTYESAETKNDRDGYGLINAARGSLGLHAWSSSFCDSMPRWCPRWPTPSVAAEIRLVLRGWCRLEPRALADA